MYQAEQSSVTEKPLNMFTWNPIAFSSFSAFLKKGLYFIHKYLKYFFYFLDEMIRLLVKNVSFQKQNVNKLPSLFLSVSWEISLKKKKQ